MTRRVDLHVHVVPEPYQDLLASHGANAGVPASLGALVANMDRFGIDASVLSIAATGLRLGDQTQINRLARAANESLATIVSSDPGRFAALAVLPLPDVEAAISELEYALDNLRLDGAILFSNTAGMYLGDPAWEALYAELDRRSAYAFVHPAEPEYVLPLANQHPMWLYEFPFDTTRAIANLIFSGTFERYPSIRYQFAHLGGAVPFLATRLASLADREPDRTRAAPAGVAEYLARHYYDTGLSQSVAAIEATRAVAPLTHIVFGTDWPYAALPEDGTDPAPQLCWLAPEERDALDWRNAVALVPRLAATG
jgi:6-methylsalicylate decarboxylase